MSAPSLCLLHLTDTHLFGTPGQRLLGIDTQLSLAAIVRHVHASTAQPDFILATGDLAQEANAGTYTRFSSMLAPLDRPVHCLPGNHDDPDLLRTTLPAASAPVADYGCWRLIMLDTHVPGSNAGSLEASQLDLLCEAAQVEPGRHVLLAMHHQPVPMGSRWLDTMQIDNADALFERLHSLPRVRGLLWGHVHQAYEGSHDWPAALHRTPLQLLASPSTCFQFTPHSHDFSLDDAMPGYRLVFLHADGSITSKLIRLPALPAEAGKLHRRAEGY